MSAIVVTFFHRPADQTAFDAWAGELAAVARAAPGFVDAAVSVHTDPRLQLAVSATFGTERQLHAWLDSAAHAAVLRDGRARGLHRASSDLVVVEGECTPPGVAVFRHPVSAGREADFIAAQGDLTTASAGFSGYEGTVVFPGTGPGGEWLTLIRFRTENLLSGWLKSPQRMAALPSLRSALDHDFSTFSHTTPLGTTVRFENGKTEMTPSWKTAMLVLMVLYPTVMLLARFLGPVLDRFGAEPWLAMWLSQVASVSLMQWVLMPFAVARTRRWLDPVAGRSRAISVRGAAAVCAVYAVTLTVFASITWLQFWDYPG
ncbi:antibiotic biosynthesis monooxygenase [Mycolicibacterium cosmeticum]|uniref:antibiotic biosynthesis monooxygenase n=1 Tax=Mycolicibacterium cosmeticum TaxID=258533 RepID=UPI0032046532